MRARREAWFELQPELDPLRLVFIDETGATTKMARLRGRSPRGERCRAAVPHGHWKTSTVVAALRCDGVSATGVFDGAINGLNRKKTDAWRATAWLAYNGAGPVGGLWINGYATLANALTISNGTLLIDTGDYTNRGPSMTVNGDGRFDDARWLARMAKLGWAGK